MSESEQRDGEACLGPDGCRGREGAGDVDKQQ